MIPQHSFDILQLVDKKTAFIRNKLADPSIKDYLLKHGYEITNIPENEEVLNKQAFNIVTIAPRKIIMPTNCPATKEIFKRHNIEVAVEMEINQLINGAGGIACATGILERSLL